MNEGSDSESTVQVSEQSLQQNHPPEIISIPPSESEPGQFFLYQSIAVDPDGDKLVWSLTASPEGMLIEPETGLMGAQTLPAGVHTISFRVEDGHGGSDSQDFKVNIHDGPIITSAPARYVYVGTPFQYYLDADDPGGLDLVYSLTAGPAGMTIDPRTGQLDWKPDSAGTVEVQLTVSNTLGKSSTQTFLITVLAPDSVTIISKPVTEALVSELYEYQVSEIDETGTAVNYSLNRAPPGMLIDADGLVNWTPESASEFNVEIAAMNGRGYMHTQSFTITAHSMEQMDTMFSGILDGVFSSLSKRNPAGAMAYLTTSAQQRLGPLFNELLGDIDQVAANYSRPVNLSISPDMAEYMVRRTGGNGDSVFMITFVRDTDQKWKINDL